MWLHRFMPAALVIAAYLAAAPSPGQKVLASIDLSGPFHTRSHWTFTAMQGPEEPGDLGDELPGRVTFCLSRDSAKTCDPAMTGRLTAAEPDELYALPHFLETAKVERARGRTLLLLRTSSAPAFNGDQGVHTQILVYDRERDAFAIAYDYLVGRNTNQEIRYVTSGPLAGDVISAEPTQNFPYGYWVVVSRLDGGAYRQVLRYRSATRYGDGNPLAVIDSEMPNIQARLGLWRPGQPLPLPKGKCSKPHLVKTALWCG